MDWLRGAKLASEPGRVVHYHNPNYQVAARLVEVVSGERFAEYLARHVLRPAGLHRSFTAATTRDVPGLAMGHVGFYGRTIAVEERTGFSTGRAEWSPLPTTWRSG